MIAPAALYRVEFDTSDQARAREFIHQAYGGRLALSAGRQSDWRVSVSKTDAADFSMADITLPADLTFKVAGRAEFVVNTLLSGTIDHDHGRASERYRPGDVYLAAQPGAEIISRTHDAGMYTVSLRASLLAEVAAAAPGEAAPVEFASWRPLDGGAQRWAEASRFVQRLLADPDRSTAPLLIGPAARLLAAAALTAFPTGLTVTAVAYRWGFSSPSRFAEHYRAAYGELPSETLR